MARTGMLLLLLAHFITSALFFDLKEIRVYPEHGTVAGVFHVSMSSSYSFNATMAREVCEKMGVTIAEKSQVQKAVDNGFETCKFGWIDEQVAVVPRIHPTDVCGQGKVGVITWRASLSTLFDVFCYNETDYEVFVNISSVYLRTTVMPTTGTSGVHSNLTKTAHSASWDDPRSTSSGHSTSVKYSPVDNTPESQAFSNTSPTSPAGLIALLTTVFAFLLLAVAAAYYRKRKSMRRWDKSPQTEQKENEHFGDSGKADQAEVKNTHTLIENANNVSVTIPLENESTALS